MSFDSVNEVVDVSISETGPGAVLASFDLGAILASSADTAALSFGSAKAKRYNATSADLSSVATDWGGTSTATYLAAAAYVAQEPRPQAFYIIKRAAVVAQEVDIAFSSSVLTGQTIIGTVNGQTVSVPFDTDMPTTLGDLETALEALEGIDAAAVSSPTVSVVAEDEWPLTIDLVVSGPGALPTIDVTVTVAGHNAADDLAEAIAEDDTNLWYGVMAAEKNKGLQLAVDAYIATTEKKFYLVTNEVASKTAGGTTSLMYQISQLSRRRTEMAWHHLTSQHADAAYMAVDLGFAPGQAQMFLKNLAGITPTPTSQLSAADVAAVEGRNGNTYRTFGSQGGVSKGVRADGVIGHATRDLDYARNEYRAAFLSYLQNTSKPPYNEAGRTQAQGIGDAVTARLALEGVFDPESQPQFIVPALSSISEGDRAQQIFSGCRVVGDLLKGVLKFEIEIQAGV